MKGKGKSDVVAVQQPRSQGAATTEPIVIEDSDEEGDSRTTSRNKRKRIGDAGNVDLTGEDNGVTIDRRSRRRVVEGASTSRQRDVIVIDD